MQPNPVLSRRSLDHVQREAAPEIGAFDGDRCELLAALCHPLTPAAFFKKHWRRKCLVVHGGRRRMAALIQEQLHGLDLQKLLADSPSEDIHVWFGQPGSGSANQTGAHGGGGNESVKTPDREAALACHRAGGGSLYFRAPAGVAEQLVTALSQQLGLSFGAVYADDGAPRGEVETFASRAGHVTDWHFDFMENFTLQLSGSKTWRVKHSQVGVPMRGCTPQWGRSSDLVRSAGEQQAKLHQQHHQAADTTAASSSIEAQLATGAVEASSTDPLWSDAEVVTLKPGSVLYVPAGTWHRVECDADSISINISLMGASYADLIVDAVRQRLRCHPSARAPICFRSITDGRRQLSRLLSLTQDELSALTPQILLPAALSLPRVVRLRLPPPADTAAFTVDGPAVRRGTLFRRSPLAVLLRLPERQEVEAADEDDEEESDNEDEESEGGQGELEEDEDDVAASEELPRLATRCGGGERLAATSDLFIDGCDAVGTSRASEGGGAQRPGGVTYVLHSHFGGEEMHSLLRVELLTSAELVPLMQWCAAAPQTFTAGQAWRGAAEAMGVAFGTVASVLIALEHNGFCVRAPKRKGRPIEAEDGAAAGAARGAAEV